MNENLIENDIYDNVFECEDDSSPPSKPPRTFAYDQVENKLSPIKPPRRRLNTGENQLDDVDLSYLTLNISTIELTHLTKNRAKQPEKRVPERHLKRQRSQSNEDTSKNIKDTAIEYLRSRRALSMVEFSRIRRTAVKIKQGNLHK